MPKMHVPLTGFSVADDGSHWNIAGVKYQDGIWSVERTKGLLANGRSYYLGEWVEITKKARRKNGFGVAPASLDYAVDRTLWENRDGHYQSIIEQVRQERQKLFERYFLMLLTKIVYSPEGDRIIHNPGLRGKNEISVRVRGPDGYIKRLKPKSLLKAIFGDNNPERVSAVYKWITEEKTFLYRLNEKPATTKERALVLGIEGGFIIGAIIIGGFGGRPAVGTRAKKISARTNF